MSALSLFKSSADLLVSVGAGAVVGNAIKASLPARSNLLNKVTIGIGGFVLSGMVGEAASKYANDQIDGVVKQFNQVKDVIKITKTEDSVKIEVEDPDKT